MWGNLAMKLEVLSAVAVCAVVKAGVVVGAKKCSAQLAIAAGGVCRGVMLPLRGAPLLVRPGRAM